MDTIVKVLATQRDSTASVRRIRFRRLNKFTCRTRVVIEEAPHHCVRTNFRVYLLSGVTGGFSRYLETDDSEVTLRRRDVNNSRNFLE